ncbi:hypothetical protein SERLA73DRAFT_157646 [Serpula lacrymans var. lacrymans S7.3]|uniref:SP-RING-type domain-containing protein n=2 Tax=Serpula lacrymans var. lacrymans TaxID=341189 RepID=F8PG46_SERL3|nr:uncharacterized protein SERLADRAFT_412304 [Serpula lacrymans var. lacrymans S7.9]EGO04293.1 hypothetical protein SERLA73DRAFT_157646 [Serpula lacrymans var. lacrymans S7.3]EGO30223.1 hypothetical protein SERLADRAFT_412304 [Serpula lacrymans var. lacrymans S7.9]
MAVADCWADFENFRHNVKQNTVDRLKQILVGFNEECFTIFSKSGKKQELIDRITTQLDIWRQANNADRWTKAKAVLLQVRSTGVYAPARMPGTVNVQALPPIQHPPYPSSSSSARSNGFQPVAPGPCNIGRYNSYAAPGKALPSSILPPSNLSNPAVRFKPSPFFRVDQAVSNIAECPESTSSTDRKQQSLTFTLNSEQLQKIGSLSPKYQLRLYCTSSTFYSPAHSGLRGPCPIEFPPTCEVRVNNVQLQSGLKGLKKKPGTAPPADLGNAVRTVGQNRLEMVYVNSQQPAQPKKFYLVVMLVEVTTVGQLVERLNKGKYYNKEEVLKKLTDTSSEDDDIIAGLQKLSLKCPLSFMRIVSPCRSVLCVHPQCFDATSWFSVMEQTTTWLCPVCEKVLNHEDLIIDGYFDQILKDTPQNVEDVIIESDGQWHTADNNYSSAVWRASHPPPFSDPPPTFRSQGGNPAVDRHAEDTSMKPITKSDVQILILDSDDEDEGRVKRELSLSHGSTSSFSIPRSASLVTAKSSRANAGEIIDLTLDSDDEETKLSKKPAKRKAHDAGVLSPTEQIWKKSRVNSVSPVTVPTIGHKGETSKASGITCTVSSTNQSNTLPSPSHTSSIPNNPPITKFTSIRYGPPPYGNVADEGIYRPYVPTSPITPRDAANAIHQPFIPNHPYPPHHSGSSRPSWS